MHPACASLPFESSIRRSGCCSARRRNTNASMPRRGLLHIVQGHLAPPAPPPHKGGEAAVSESPQLLVNRAAATSAGAPLRRVQQLCGPLNHNGHIVADIHKAMDDWVSCGVGPWCASPLG